MTKQNEADKIFLSWKDRALISVLLINSFNAKIEASDKALVEKRDRTAKVMANEAIGALRILGKVDIMEAVNTAREWLDDKFDEETGNSFAYTSMAKLAREWNNDSNLVVPHNVVWLNITTLVHATEKYLDNNSTTQSPADLARQAAGNLPATSQVTANTISS